MAFAHAAVTTGGEPVQVTLDDLDGRPDSFVIIRNAGSVTVYLGAADVTSSDGFPLKADEVITSDVVTAGYSAADASKDSALYAVSDTAGELRVLAGGV